MLVAGLSLPLLLPFEVSALESSLPLPLFLGAIVGSVGLGGGYVYVYVCMWREGKGFVGKEDVWLGFDEDLVLLESSE